MKLRTLSLGGLLGIVLMVAIPAEACWYGERFPEGSDMVMMDLAYPYWPESTYFACWNLEVNKGGYFYAGVACSTPKPEEAETYAPGTVWSFWPHDSFEGRQVRNVYMNPDVYAKQYVAEGASGSAGAKKLPWIKLKQWYTMTLRLWGTDEKTKECFVGQWIKDQTTNQWHHLATFKVPNASTGFMGRNGGFLEDFGHGGRNQREIWHGKGFARFNKEWKKANEILIDVPEYKGINYQGWHVKEMDGGKYYSIAHSNNPELGQNIEPGKQHSFPVNQPETPTLDALKASATGTLLDNQLSVTWELDEFSSPQLGYKVEIFDNEAMEGTPLVVEEEMVPQQRTATLALPKSEKYFVKLTLTDIFDQEIVLPVKELAQGELLKAVKEKVVPGLEYTYVEGSEPIRTMEGVDFSKATRSGVSRGLDITLRGNRGDKLAFKFEGFLDVPETGAYTVTLKSCDGSVLTLGGKKIINNDGIHSSSDATTSCYLEKGLVPLSLTFFKNENDPTHTDLSLSWSRGAQAMERIPAEKFVRKVDPQIPTIALKPKNIKGHITVVPESSTKAIKKIEYYNGRKLVSIADKAPFTAEVPLLQGDNMVWARLFYGEHSTIDSAPIAIKGNDSKDPAWTYSLLGEQTKNNGILTRDGQFSFVGEGEYFINKPIKGDFEVVAKVDQFKSREQGAHDVAWAGLIVMPKRELGLEIAIMQSAGIGLRTSPTHNDLGYCRHSPYELPKDHPWLKITRRGNMFTCLYSKDKKEWTIGFERYITMPEEVYAGLQFRAIPMSGDVYFTAAMSGLEITPKSFPAEKINPPVKLGKVAGYHVLGEDKAIVRMVNGGAKLITRQADGTFKAIGLTLPKGVSFARSIVGQGDTLVLLAPVGKTASVFTSHDGGKSWKETLKDLAIEASPELTVGGDLITANPNTPGQWMLASNKTGAYFSEDNAETWTKRGLENEPVSDIAYSPIIQDVLYAAVFDREAKVSRLFESRDFGKSWHKAIEMPDIGFLKIIYDQRNDDKVFMMTTNGFMMSFTSGRDYIRLNQVIPNSKTYIAGDNVKIDATLYWMAPLDGSGLYYSDRFAETWQDRSAGIPAWGNVFRIKINKGNPESFTVYAENGVFSTEDAAKTWKKLL